MASSYLPWSLQFIRNPITDISVNHDVYFWNYCLIFWICFWSRIRTQLHVLKSYMPAGGPAFADAALELQRWGYDRESSSLMNCTEDRFWHLPQSCLCFSGVMISGGFSCLLPSWHSMPRYFSLAVTETAHLNRTLWMHEPK